MPLILLPVAILILAAYGVYAVISATYNPWHLVALAAALGGVVLAVRLGSAAIDRWRTRK